MSIRHTRPAPPVIVGLVAAAALAIGASPASAAGELQQQWNADPAPQVLDTGMFEHEWLKGDRRGTATAASDSVTRPFWPAAFPQVLALAKVEEDTSGPS